MINNKFDRNFMAINGVLYPFNSLYNKRYKNKNEESTKLSMKLEIPVGRLFFRLVNVITSSTGEKLFGHGNMVRYKPIIFYNFGNLIDWNDGG